MTLSELKLTRRTMLHAGLVGGFALVATGCITDAARASTGIPGVTVTDLGPGAIQFASKSAVQIGDTIYIGSRNLDPSYVVAFHMPTRTVTGKAAVPGRSVEGIDLDPSGRYLYFATQKPEAGVDDLYRWDLQNPTSDAEPIGSAGGPVVWALSTTPDGVSYFGGNEAPPRLRQYDPTTGQVTELGIVNDTATGIRTILTTDTTVYIGSGTVVNGGPGSARAVLVAYDRASGEFRDILPAPLAPDDTVRQLALVDDRLIVSSASASGLCHVAVMNIADPSDYWSVEVDGVTTKALVVADDDVYFIARAGDMRRLSLTDRQLSRVTFGGLDLGEVWGIGWQGGRLHAVSSYGFVAHIDPADYSWETTDLISVGAPSAPQLGMSVSAGGGFAYVAANGALARHHLGNGSTLTLPIPGESKAQAVIGGQVYMGQYSSQGLYAYDPKAEGNPRQVAELPTEQNRPFGVTWDNVNRRVLVTTQSDSDGGGSVGVYDPVTGDIRVFINPLDANQLIAAIVSKDGVAYIGGDNVTKVGHPGEVAALDPLTGEVLWRVDPQHSVGVADLALLGDHLYVMLRTGGFRIIDVRSRSIIHSANLKSLSSNRSSLVVSGGRVHGVSSKNLYRFDPVTFEPTLLVSDLDGCWYGGVPTVAADDHGDLYTLRERNLVRIEVPSFPGVQADATLRRTGATAKLTVTVKNTEAIPIDIAVATSYGSKQYRGVLPGEAVSHPFNVRSRRVPAGEVTITARAAVAHTTVSAATTLKYDGIG